MKTTDPLIAKLLDDYVPARPGEQPDWDGVLRRAGSPATPATGSWLTRRRLAVLLAAALAALLVPLLAVGATQGWWFTRDGGAPKPEGAIVIARQGSWNGVPWALTAYRTHDNICFGLTPNWQASDAGSGAGMACGVPVYGIARQSSAPGQLHWVGFLTSGAEKNFPGWIAGPAAEQVAEVDVVLQNGSVITTPTFAAPGELGLKTNFYVAQLPCGQQVSALIPKDAAGHALENWKIASFPNAPSPDCGG